MVSRKPATTTPLPLVEHTLQKHILSVLLYHNVARFRDFRLARVDTNLMAYHLKLLVKAGYVHKLSTGYTLAPKGLEYVDRANATTLFIRTQPKIITMLVVQNDEGDVLLQRRAKQPYIDTWTLPYGKVHIDDPSLLQAAQREAFEKLGLSAQPMQHAGDCYIRVYTPGEAASRELLSTTLAHVFFFESNAIQPTGSLQWVRPHKITHLKLAPAVEAIMTRVFFHDPYFFEEYDTEWKTAILRNTTARFIKPSN